MNPIIYLALTTASAQVVIGNRDRINQMDRSKLAYLMVITTTVAEYIIDRTNIAKDASIGVLRR